MLLRRKNLLRLCVGALVVLLVTMQLFSRFWNQSGSAVKRGGVQVIAVDDRVVPPVNDVVPPVDDVVPPVDDNKGSSHRDYNENNNDHYTGNGDGTRRPKIILQWTRVFNHPMPLASIDECSFTPEETCLMTRNRSLLSDASAVVFHINPIDFRMNDLPKLRKPHQLFVFMTMEAAFTQEREFIESLPANYFNITMTDRLDADIPYVYGGYWIRPEDAKNFGFAPVDLPYDPVIVLRNKSKTIFWLVSNCWTISKRELAVKKLSRYIQVDIYGQCARTKEMKHACPRKDSRACEMRMSEEYYFYIAIENTICKDYVTEKYWDRYVWNSVPIVMRRKTYEDRMIPPKSFIAMDDYRSAKEMSDHLHYLMSNQSAYMQYFGYREEGWAHVWQKAPFRYGYCKLCERIGAKNFRNEKSRVVENIAEWFFDKSECERDEFSKSWK